MGNNPHVFFEIRNAKTVNDPQHPAITYDLYLSVSEEYVNYVSSHGEGYGIQGVDVGMDVDFGQNGTVRSGLDTIKLAGHIGEIVSSQISELRSVNTIPELPDGDFDAGYKVALMRAENSSPLSTTPTHVASLKAIFPAGTIIGSYDNGAKIRLRCHATGFGTKANSSKWGDFRGNVQKAVSSADAWASLPVTLVAFDAVLNDEGNALLTWETTEEKNSDRFEVEKSLDGKHWKMIAVVKAQGESSVSHKYTAVDNDLAKGDQYYRLHMIDKDGSNMYSRIRLVRAQSASTSLAPNPASDHFSIITPDWNSISRIRITSSTGINIYDSGNAPQRHIDTSRLPVGIYLVEVTRQIGVATIHKLFVVK
ncbi:T9SS type A sorting domain-containing protein [Dyadobacter sp. SG02]|uniref:T9SS type A sorting domain-containing protein n=1 Tax=Dyadobacter sp. SG02 TaxID=1855291 RepID=UPI0015A5502E|nr:T9SS type A sorting domain-containing protein [Dyadobacter sp. SG02]